MKPLPLTLQLLIQYTKYQLRSLLLVDSMQRSSGLTHGPTRTEDIQEPVHLLRERVEGH